MSAQLQLTLPDLAERINAEHAACMAAAQDAVMKAIEVGRLLCEARGRVQHGQWAVWVGEHCSFGARQASSYMKAYRERGQIGSALPISGSLRGALAVLAPAAVPDRQQDDRPGLKPITEWTPEHRAWTCEQWWDCQAQFTVMLDAAGWEPDVIADFLGRPEEEIEAILDPEIPYHDFEEGFDGGLLTDDVEPTEMARHYRDCVSHQIDTWLEKACREAAITCEGHGFGDVRPILLDRERRHRRARESAERRGASSMPYAYTDREPTRRDLQYGPYRERSGFVASWALRWCVILDARHAVRIGGPVEWPVGEGSVDAHWSPKLCEMWFELMGIIEPLESEVFGAI